MLQVLFIKLMAPFYLGAIAMNILGQKQDVNFITRDKVDRMSSAINCKATKELHFKDIRQMSKTLGVTINDVVTCAISSAMKQFFIENNDP